jgi:hypothetical protein
MLYKISPSFPGGLCLRERRSHTRTGYGAFLRHLELAGIRWVTIKNSPRNLEGRLLVLFKDGCKGRSRGQVAKTSLLDVACVQGWATEPGLAYL